MFKRPRYRRRELLPYPGSMRPLYYRRRVVRQLFTSSLEQEQAARLIANGASPMGVRKGVPLFWYAAFGVGGLQWLESAGLSNHEISRKATLPDGSRRTLFEQVVMMPLSLRHLLGRGVGSHRLRSDVAIAYRPPSAQRKPNYDELAAYLLDRGAQTPEPDMVFSLLARDWPLVRAALQSHLMGREALAPNESSQENRRL